MTSWLLTCFLVYVMCYEVTANLNLLILHTNDMHSRFEQTSQMSSKCSEKDTNNNKCYGGFARVAYKVKEARQNAIAGRGPPVIFLNAGDTYQGTVWFSIHKWRIVADLTNRLGIDVASLGNHEFDDNVAGLVPYIKNSSYPIVAANLDLRSEPTLAATNLSKSVVLNVQGKKIGVIGYLTTETRNISSTGLVEFLDEVVSVRKEAERLKAQGVNILIALGHAGFTMDKVIAEQVADIDIVVGGHTNTFLYTGKSPDPADEIQGPYPTVVRQRSGRMVPVVQAYAYTKYLGNLEVTFDDRGELIAWKGNPILLDNNVPQDPSMLRALEPWRQGIEKQNKMQLGVSKVYLKGDGKYCRVAECNMGNLVTDAMIHYYVSTTRNIPGGWTDAPIAMVNSGSIRADIEVSSESENGMITMGDVLTVLPFENSLVYVHLKGEHILEALEWNVDSFDPKGLAAFGRFLQFSGLRVVYDLCKPKNKRVVSVFLRCGNCSQPEYEPIDHTKSYGVLMPTYIMNNGDGFKFQSRITHQRILDITDSGVLGEYISKTTPIYPGIEGRITFANTCSNIPVRSSASPLSPQVVLILLLGVIYLRYS